MKIKLLTNLKPSCEKIIIFSRSETNTFTSMGEISISMDGIIGIRSRDDLLSKFSTQKILAT